ncbi:hypothetical protein HPB51_007961 [Rhipicephalus microplus]|uniref:Uncharacterized protein n=1 Tax=Rhipicephalus microplus TaxID=6941 RepID=A0A9J6DT61_RHIMP|nr:hypothetical protein HPB51_007961 [Rhipicephalus microplus]
MQEVTQRRKFVDGSSDSKAEARHTREALASVSRRALKWNATLLVFKPVRLAFCGPVVDSNPTSSWNRRGKRNFRVPSEQKKRRRTRAVREPVRGPEIAPLRESGSRSCALFSLLEWLSPTRRVCGNKHTIFGPTLAGVAKEKHAARVISSTTCSIRKQREGVICCVARRFNLALRGYLPSSMPLTLPPFRASLVRPGKLYTCAPHVAGVSVPCGGPYWR